MIETYGIYGREKVWLGIDPGVTTGWAVVKNDGEVVASGDLKEPDLRYGLDEIIRGLHRGESTVEVAIERMPRVGGQGQLARAIDRVLAIIHEVVWEVYELNIHVASPGEWKPSRVGRRKREWPKKMSQHRKDAIMLTQYVIDRGARATRRNGKRRPGTPRRHQ